MVSNRRRSLSGPVIFILGLAISILFPLCPMAAPHGETSRFDKGWEAYSKGDFSRAATIWQALAEKGHQTAQINLGAMYDSGQGVNQDPEQAVHWYHAAAEENNAYGQYNLGAMYLSGRGVFRDPDRAVNLFLEAADQNMPRAQYQLGLLYLSAFESRGIADTKTPALFRQPPPLLRAGALKWFRAYGTTCSGNGDWDGVKTAVENIRKISPEDPSLALLASKLPASPSMKEEFSGSAIGTGWPIDAGYVITNNHVVADSRNVTLVDVDGKKFTAWAVLRDEIHDIAFLAVTDFDSLPPALPLASEPLLPGTPVFTIGYPRPDFLGTSPKLSEGEISLLEGPDNNSTLYQTTVTVQPGNSGGPLLNMQGEVVGLVTAMLALRDETRNTLQILENASCALKIEELKNHLGQLPHREKMRQYPQRPACPSPMVSQIQRSTLMVVAR